MFRIRRIHDAAMPGNRRAIAAVQGMLRAQFPDVLQSEIDDLPDLLADPVRFRLRTVLLVAEGTRLGVRGFAQLRYAPDIGVGLLDFLSTAAGGTGGGVGGALYEVARQEARSLGCKGLFLECLNDAPSSQPDPAVLRQNEARLRFYERRGAYPIEGTGYETQVRPGDTNSYFLVFDDLGTGLPLSRAVARLAARAILERSYRDDWPAGHIDAVVASFLDDPVRLRAPRHGARPPEKVSPAVSAARQIVLIVNDKHDIHHVREKGYVESPVRIASILRQLEPTGLFRRVPPRVHGERHIRAVHAPAYVAYLKRVCSNLPPGTAVYPEVFPLRNRSRPPSALSDRSGYYCMDGFTPLTSNVFVAARRAVDCALTGADHLLDGYRLAYALVRPPGHHAERSIFGGFCYFNSSAVAAEFLSQHGRVAMLDLDYHAGNGQQDIFYERDDVLTVSIHGHPRTAYPHFTGFAEERGEGAGAGFNRNYPLRGDVDGPAYSKTLATALRRVREFEPDFLVVPLGLDTAKGDPAGTWSLRARDFAANGTAVGSLGLPTLVVQEGGYRTRSLGINARSFFTGLWEASTRKA